MTQNKKNQLKNLNLAGVVLCLLMAFPILRGGFNTIVSIANLILAIYLITEANSARMSKLPMYIVIAAAITSLLTTIFVTILFWVPILGWIFLGIAGIIRYVLWIAMVAAAVFYFINVSNLVSGGTDEGFGFGKAGERPFRGSADPIIDGTADIVEDVMEADISIVDEFAKKARNVAEDLVEDVSDVIEKVVKDKDAPTTTTVAEEIVEAEIVETTNIPTDIPTAAPTSTTETTTDFMSGKATGTIGGDTSTETNTSEDITTKKDDTTPTAE